MGSGMQIQMKQNKIWSDVQKQTLDKPEPFCRTFAGLEMPLQNSLSSKLSATACARVELHAKMDIDMV